MYSENSGKLYCVPCQLFGGTTKFTKEGCDYWKHGNEVLKSHENFSNHKYIGNENQDVIEGNKLTAFKSN